MNKTHEKYYIPLDQLKMDREEYNYRAFCIEFESYAKIFKSFMGTDDLLEQFSRAEIQHYMHGIARLYEIDRGDFAKVNNLEGLPGWYEMILEYRKRLSPDELYIPLRL